MCLKKCSHQDEVRMGDSKDRCEAASSRAVTIGLGRPWDLYLRNREAFDWDVTFADGSR